MSDGPLTRRSVQLEAILGDRAPWLVPWLPVVGAAAGLATGAVCWRLIGSDVLLLREGALIVGAAIGAAVGLLERTRAGRWLLENLPDERPPDDLPAEFKTSRRGFDHREDAFQRRTRL